MTRVTVAIIAYYRQFLKECIESVLNQTYKEIKVIVYDDCSPEDLKSIVDSFNDERLHYFRNEKNLGTFGNTNQAIDLCDTEYINVFHGDDVMFPQMIEKLFNAMEKNKNIMIAASKWRPVDLKLVPLSSVRKGFGRDCVKIYAANEFVREYVKTARFNMACPSTFIRKKKVDQVGIRYNLDVGSAADLYFFLEMNSKGLELCFLNEELLFWRRHDKTYSVTRTLQEALGTLIAVDDLIKSLNLGVSLDKWHAYCALIPISHYVWFLCKERSVKALKDFIALRRRLENENGWFISDTLFNDLVSVYHVGDTVLKISEGLAPFSLFLEKEKDLRELDISIPLKRKMKWFVKYAIYKRVLRRAR